MQPKPANSPADFYRENGYYLARGLYSAAEAKTLEADFDRIVEQIIAGGEKKINATWQARMNAEVPNAAILHAKQLHMYSPRWLQAWQDPRFLDLAEAFLGPDIILHHSKLFLKPPGRGAGFPPHQDWSYFPTEEDTSCLAAVIHLSPADEANGCLRIFPGSHKDGRIVQDRGLSDVPEIDRRYPIDQGVPVEAMPGDVVFFSSLTVHGSLPNRSPMPRKTVLVQLHRGSDWIDPTLHANARLVLRGWNHRMTAGASEG